MKMLRTFAPLFRRPITQRQSLHPLLRACLMSSVTLAAVAIIVQSAATAPAPGFATATAPKRFDVPKVNGQCDDPVYAESGLVELRDRSGSFGAPAWVLHSTLDLYLCFTNLPAATREGPVARVSVLIDGDNRGGIVAQPGDYRFSVSPTGKLLVERGDGFGGFAPLVVPTGDFEAVVRSLGAEGWSAEVRISLEWLGGYARTDGLSLLVEAPNGTPLLQWPPGAKAEAPASWGQLVLSPVYPASLNTGAVFLDGRKSYLVVPYSPALNPAQITIEAWVKVSEGDWGTLVGNGRAGSYWVALGEALQFSIAGEPS